MKIVGEPVCGLGQVDEAVLDRRRLGVEAHDLVAIGSAAHSRAKMRQHALPQRPVI